MAKENTSNNTQSNGKLVRTLFILMFPSVLIAGDYGMSFGANILLKGSLIFFQYIVIKTVLDDYYRYIN